MHKKRDVGLVVLALFVFVFLGAEGTVNQNEFNRVKKVAYQNVKDVTALKARVKKLEKRVARLEAEESGKQDREENGGAVSKGQLKGEKLRIWKLGRDAARDYYNQLVSGGRSFHYKWNNNIQPLGKYLKRTSTGDYLVQFPLEPEGNWAPESIWVDITDYGTRLQVADVDLAKNK